MQDLLQQIVVGNIFAFLLIFMRLGMALLIMPGIGDSFVSPQIRLLFALAMSFVLTPFLASYLPSIPTNSGVMFSLLLTEAIIGLFIGTVMRIMISALDTAGNIISAQVGYASAMLFNPVTQSQGSLIGSLYSMLGVTMLLVTNAHHYMLASVVESYHLFPATGSLPAPQSLAESIGVAVSTAFRIGVQLSIPFLIIGTLVQVGFGLLGRLMPQVQVFFIALPLQILLGLVVLTMAVSAGILYWLDGYESMITRTLAP